jgi:abnormal spindle-like microcephaly-associated protein
MQLALKNFITTRLLSDDKVLEKYTGGLCKVPSGRFESKYRAELRTLVLYRLLVLFFFLDRAKQDDVLDVAPRLFAKGSVVKSSRDVLLAFCRDFLSAEGDFVKHLGRVGLKVFYRQEPVDELDFTISNLASDLRDGVRLARMTEIVTKVPRNSILLTLRLPAVSRLQKLHNVNAVLERLRTVGVPVPNDIAAHHLVDAHRERALKLLWSVVAHCCLKDLLQAERVEVEIHRIRTLGKRARFIPPPPVGPANSSADPDSELTFKSLMVRWANAVCSQFGCPIKDLTVSFADGKAVCYLIHYYHPNLIRLDEINVATFAGRQERRGENWEDRLRKEHANAKLANRRMSELGGIPEMIPFCDSSRPPEAKSMLLCLAFLCSRLLESDSEIRSCVVIQNWYRHFWNQRLLSRKQEAARFILFAWRANRVSFFHSFARRYGPSVALIENFVLNHRPSLQRLRHSRIEKKAQLDAATVIQVSLKMPNYFGASSVSYPTSLLSETL